MAILDTLKLVKASKRHDNSPEMRLRRKMLEGLDLQITAATADSEGKPFVRTVPRWIDNPATGQREMKTVPARFRRWWWEEVTGEITLELFYAHKAIEIKPGMSAITVATKDELLPLLKRVREAVVAGELDANLKEAAIDRRRAKTPHVYKPKKTI